MQKANGLRIESMERIAEQLERIADAMEKQNAGNQMVMGDGRQIARMIKIYGFDTEGTSGIEKE